MPDWLAAVACDKECAQQLFSPGFCGWVHSVYRRVINFYGPDARPYSLAAATLDNAPYTLRVFLPPGFWLDAAGIAPGDTVCFDGELLTVGKGLVVDTTGIIYWDAALPAFPDVSSCAALASNLAVLRQSIASSGTAGGMREFGATANSQQPASTVGRELCIRAGKLLTALESGDMAAGRVHARSMLGLGLGQTPSGDDFLCGLLTVFRMPGDVFGDEHSQLAQFLADEARKMTGVISQAMLVQAACGRARETVIDLLIATTTGQSGNVVAAAARLMAIGAASGTDIAVGLAAGLGHGLWIQQHRARGGIYGN